MVKVNVHYLNAYKNWYITKSSNITLPAFTKRDVVNYLAKNNVISIINEDQDDEIADIDLRIVNQYIRQMKQPNDGNLIQFMSGEFGYIFILGE